MNFPSQADKRSLPSAAQTSHLLQSLFPPQAVILVGVSRSQPHLFDWPSVRTENILLVDAAPEALANTRQSLPKTTAWQMRSAVLADHAGEACFFTASNPGEDGLVPPQQLAELWPNLRTTAERTCTTQTLHALLAEPELAGLAEVDDTWLVIDCLPALRILRGAGALLQRCKVISLRVLREPLEQDEPGMTLAEAERYLAEHHFRCIHCTEENHPQIGQALFLRDDSAQHGQEIACFLQAQADLADERDNLEQQNAALLATCQALKTDNTALQAEREALRQDNTALVAERDALAHEKTHLAFECDKLTTERDQQTELAAALQAQLEALAREKAELLAASDALAKEKAVLAAARDKLTGERDQLAELAAERQAQLDTLAKENAELLVSCNALGLEKTELAAARDEQAKLAIERQTLIETLTQEKTDLAAARDALAKEKAALTAARDEQANLVNERQTRIATLTQEKNCLAAARDELTGERDQQAKLATERQVQLDTLAKQKAELLAAHDALAQEKAGLVAARDEQAKLANERQARIDALTLEKADLATARDSLTAERDQQAKRAAERDEHVRRLEAELQENLVRQGLLQDELVKGEAQIELIKDLLLRIPNGSTDHVE